MSSSGTTATASLAALDPAAGTARALTPAVSSGLMTNVTDGVWVVQHAESSAEFGIVDIDSGTTQILRAADFGLSTFTPLGVAKPIIVGTADGNSAANVVIAANAKRVVMRVNDVTLGAVAVSPSYAIAVTKLQTGETQQSAIVFDLAKVSQTTVGHGAELSLPKIVAEKGYWADVAASAGTATVQAVTLATGAVEASYVTSGLQRSSGGQTTLYSLPVAFNDAGMVIVDSSRAASATTISDSLRWVPRSGSAVTLATYDMPIVTSSSSDAEYLAVLAENGFFAPWIAGNRIVLRNSSAKQWQIYDLSTGQTRNFMPFQ